LTPFRFITLMTVLGLMITIVSLALLFSINAYAMLQPSNQPSSVQSAGAQDRASEPAHPPQVILNNPIFPEISEQFLREVFSGKMRHWPDGKLIKVVVLKSDSPLHQAFIQLRLRMFPYQVQRLWNKRIYSGRADPPIVVKDINAMRAMVLNTPGAIGYLPYGEGKNKPGQKLETKTYAGLSQRRNQLSAGQ
jgi:hypothetical protein